MECQPIEGHAEKKPHLTITSRLAVTSTRPHDGAMDWDTKWVFYLGSKTEVSVNIHFYQPSFADVSY